MVCPKYSEDSSGLANRKKSCLLHKSVPTHGMEWRELVTHSQTFNPLTPRSDRNVNYPYIFNRVSSRQVTRMKKIIILGDMVLI